MHKIKECLRLKLDSGLPHERIARSLGLSKGVVSKYVARAQEAGLDWAAIAVLDDSAIAARLCVAAPAVRGERAAIDLPWVHRELRRKGVTLQLLWQEYGQAQADRPTYRYTQFCQHYHDYAGSASLDGERTAALDAAGACHHPEHSGRTAAPVHEPALVPAQSAADGLGGAAGGSGGV
ncbi:MAG: transposase [Proteobacteria bacterium]|nr:transposase [Pseudomonadota bacterium]